MLKLNIYKIVVDAANEGGVLYNVASYSLEAAIRKLRDYGIYEDIANSELVLEVIV